MNEIDTTEMRVAYDKTGILSASTMIIDGPSFTRERVGESYNRVHYPPDVYDAGAQVLANAFEWILPESDAALEKFTPPETGKMAKPFLGMMMLCLCFIGLFFFDGFFGFSYLACLFIKGVLPSDLYLEAFSILHEKSNLPPLSMASGASPESSSFTSKKYKTSNNASTAMRRAGVGDESGVDDEIAALLGDGRESSLELRPLGQL